MAKKLNDEYLEELFTSAIEGLNNDLKEAEENIDLYHEKLINTPTGIDQFGTIHNDSLRIKGLVRERQLKLLLLIKDKIQKQTESDKALGNNSSAPEQIVKITEEDAKRIREELKNERRERKQKFDNLIEEDDNGGEE
jgi:hypothetical protein